MPSEHPSSGDVLLLVGTRKGAFVYWSDPERKDWKRTFHHEGWMVHHLAYDQRAAAIYAATNSEVFGGLIQRSLDFGSTWKHRNEKLDYPASSEHRVRKVWHVRPGHPRDPERVYAGVERAGLFMSNDRGDTWEEVEGLNNHPTSQDWSPGAGGLCLHTILIDPEDADRMYVAISTGGVYRSDDGGNSWTPKNKGVRADFLPETYPEFGQCVHKLAMHPDQPNLLYQQNHCGVYRSDDRGENWVEISAGLPSDFGFPFVVNSSDPATIYVAPLVSAQQRVVPEGRMTVWRSRNGGESWKPMTKGLPEGAYLTILREAMAADALDPCGVYVGTQTGQVFISRDEGETWELLADFLPPVYSLSTGFLE